MAEPETADEKKTATKRLAFDSENSDDIPQFLKKGQPKKVEPEEEENNPNDLEPEVTDPISEDDSTENEEMDQIVSKQAKSMKMGVPKSFSDLAAEMTIDQLRKQQEEIDRRIKEKQSAEKQAVIEQIVSVVTEYNIPIEELVEALGGTKNKRKGSKAKAKYRDPATGNTWSGRGKEPAWIKGADRTPFEI